MINIEDRTGTQQNFDVGRSGESAILFVAHDTSNPNDRNDVDAATAKAGVEATIRWLTLPAGSGGGGVSTHYLIGPEPMGAPIYRLVNESDVAWHAGGNPDQGFPSSWADTSTGKTYITYDVNVHSIGVEVYRRPGDPIGPKQRAAMIALTQDIVSRHPKMLLLNHIVSHAAIQRNRRDGTDWVALAGATASQFNASKVPPMPPVPLPPLSAPGLDGTFFTLNSVGSYIMKSAPGYEINDASGFLTRWKMGGVPAWGLPISPAYHSATLNKIVQAFGGAIMVAENSPPPWNVSTLGIFDPQFDAVRAEIKAMHQPAPVPPALLVPPAVKP